MYLTCSNRSLEKRQYDVSKVDWSAVDKTVDWDAVFGKKPAAMAPGTGTQGGNAAVGNTDFVAKPAVTSSVPPPPVVHTESKSSGGSSQSGLFKGLVGTANGLKAFGSGTSPDQTLGQNQIGNTGVNYDGSNMILIDAVTDAYSLTNTFKNTSPSPMTIVIWNKAGSLGPQSGFTSASTSPALTFVLGPNDSQVVAFQNLSIIGWAEYSSQTTIGPGGNFATPIGEATMISPGTGYDLSLIPSEPNGANNYKMSIVSAEADNCLSDNSHAFWTRDDPSNPMTGHIVNGGNCFANSESAHLITEMGGAMDVSTDPSATS